MTYKYLQKLFQFEIMIEVVLFGNKRVGNGIKDEGVFFGLCVF
jgi:hypothetical protein